MYEKMLPREPKAGYRGYYPVTTASEWDELPAVYKAMDWFPVEVNKLGFDGHYHKQTTFVKEVIFDVTFLTPYKVRAKVSVHRQEFQKIMFCVFGNTDCNLYSVCGVEFENGETANAKWEMDSRTGAFRIISYGQCVGKQGGFMGHIPARVVETEDGFKYNQDYDSYRSEVISHYELCNPYN